MSFINRFLCSSVFWAAAPLCAQAPPSAVPLPGLESDPTGVVEVRTCAVSLIGGKVTVELSVHGTGDAPALMLNGVPFGWAGASAPYPDRQFPELAIRLDGVPLSPEDRFEAFNGRSNISQLIRLAGLDPWAITRTPPLTAAHTQSPQVLKGLQNMGAIERSGDEYLAKWTARRILRIPLKAVPDQRVELSYTARPAASSLTADQLGTRARERTYCLSPKQLNRLSRSGPTSVFAVQEFTIPVGIDGIPPASVVLTMSLGAEHRGAPAAQVFLCGPHGKPIAKTGALSRERVDVDDAGTLHVLSVLPAPADVPRIDR